MKNTSLALATSLALCACPVFADDEVLDSAAAVREMIQDMDIPQAEKDRFLSQVGVVEGIQTTAIRLDIDSLLLEFEGALREWTANQQLWEEWDLESTRIMSRSWQELAKGNQAESDRLSAIVEEMLRNTPPGGLRLLARVKELDDILTREFRAAERDGVDVRSQLARYGTAVVYAEEMLGETLAELYEENNL